MNAPSASSVLNAIVEEFGDNALFALELYTQYRFEPGSVGENWKRTFQEMEERVPHALSPSANFRLPAPETGLLPAAAAPGSTAAVSPAPPATRPPAPGPRAVVHAFPISGGAATIVRNMEASLGVPTPPTTRVI